MIKVIEVLALDNDVLLVRGEDDGEPVDGRGWVSALEQHFDGGSYDAVGHLKQNAKPRKMTKPEQLDYCKQVLTESRPGKTGGERKLNIKG